MAVTQWRLTWHKQGFKKTRFENRIEEETFAALFLSRSF
jgi:hypothetical protein